MHQAQGSPVLVIGGVEYTVTLGTQTTNAPIAFGGDAEEIDCTAIISKADLTTDPSAATGFASNEAENIRYRIVTVREPEGSGTYEVDLRRDAREFYLMLGTSGDGKMITDTGARLIL